SSIRPSQSLSSPSQRSALGPVSPTQTRAPSTHVSTPSSHSPSPVPPHAAPPSGLPSSTSPSQSSSSALQASALGPVSPSQTRVPPEHRVVPGAHSPTSVPHALPPPGSPSSMSESQSSSAPLQISLCGARSPRQTKLPPMQVRTPSPQVPQEAPVGISSSMRVSQSLSRPSQVSAEGPMPPMHTSVPPLQVRTPVSQSPMPVPQAPPPPGFPSSGVPLQSLSSPSQISGEGPIAPTHVP